MAFREPEYEPLLFDVYVEEAAAALDRCLSLRREIQEIESLALGFARTYLRFDRTSEVDRELEDRHAAAGALHNLSNEFSEASKLYKPDSNSQIAGAQQRQTKALSDSYKATASDYLAKQEASQRKWIILSAISSAERAQHRNRDTPFISESAARGSWDC